MFFFSAQPTFHPPLPAAARSQNDAFRYAYSAAAIARIAAPPTTRAEESPFSTPTPGAARAARGPPPDSSFSRALSAAPELGLPRGTAPE